MTLFLLTSVSALLPSPSIVPASKHHGTITGAVQRQRKCYRIVDFKYALQQDAAGIADCLRICAVVLDIADRDIQYAGSRSLQQTGIGEHSTVADREYSADRLDRA